MFTVALYRYLGSFRGVKASPRTGSFLTLVINGLKFDVRDLVERCSGGRHLDTTCRKRTTAHAGRVARLLPGIFVCDGAAAGFCWQNCWCFGQSFCLVPFIGFKASGISFVLVRDSRLVQEDASCAGGCCSVLA